MKFPDSKLEAQENIELLIKEISSHIDSQGKIDVHINQVFTSINQKEDYTRQSFIFFVLCKAKFFFPLDVSDELLQSAFDYIKNNYESNVQLSDFERRYIEAFIVRGCLFWKKDASFFLGNLNKHSIGLLGSSPLLLHLVLATEADSLQYAHKKSIDSHIVDICKEAVFYSLKSEQKDANKAFHYVDIFYYNDSLRLDYKVTAEKLVDKKIWKELERKESVYTSVLAKMFEGFTALYPENLTSTKLFFNLCVKRKVKLNPYLVSSFRYTSDSISEIENTAYVCLDTSAHLILGLLNLYQKYEK